MGENEQSMMGEGGGAPTHSTARNGFLNLLLPSSLPCGASWTRAWRSTRRPLAQRSDRVRGPLLAHIRPESSEVESSSSKSSGLICPALFPLGGCGSGGC